METIRTEYVPGGTGAARQSWRHSPRDLLHTLIEKNPDATERELLSLFTREVEAEPDYLPPIIEYWFALNYRSAVRAANIYAGKGKRPARRNSPRDEKAKQAQAKKDVEKAVKSAIKREAVKLLDLVMSNGKPARDNTFAQAAKEGGFWSRVATLGKPRQRIGDVLSEEKLRQLL